MAMPITHDTRAKILSVAKVLFARNGYEGTSVRDIASAAGVNVAAINYHFDNKQGLYFEIVKTNCAWMEERLAEIRGKEAMSTSEFVQRVLQFYLDEGHALMISFKMMLEDSLSVPEDVQTPGPEGAGPPGGQTILGLITDEVGESVPLSARNWAMGMIFRQTVHTGVMMNSSVAKTRCDKAYQEIETMKQHLSLHAEAVLEYIKRNSHRFA